jgi:acetyltransferase
VNNGVVASPAAGPSVASSMAWLDTRAPVEFADGRSITFRPIVPSDGEALRDLFEQLSPVDRYRRFFNAYHPRREFCVEQASVWARGGARFVAVLHTPGDERLIAEAGYSLTKAGAGEVSVTVASGWRGWLGPYLLDTLVEHAAAVGARQLEADVLAENRSMLALLRSRGAVVIGRDGFSQLRMRFPTANRGAAVAAASPRRGSHATVG